jgi:hypothetical protein
VPLDVSVVLPAVIGSPSYEAVDRTSLGARASAGDGVESNGATAEGNGSVAARRGVFRIPRNYR